LSKINGGIERWQIMAIDTENFLNELNLDVTDSNKSLVSELLAQAENIICHSVDSSVDTAKYEENPIFVRCSKTLATQLFYDRTLANGMSDGVLMMINYLKGQVVTSDGTETDTQN
jgi:hypothetical protein